MILTCQPRTRSAYRLLHEGSLALARVEAAGLRVDLPYYERLDAKLAARVTELERALPATELGRAWRAAFPRPAWASGVELGKVLDRLGAEKRATGKGRRAVDEDALRACGISGIGPLLEWRKLTKLRGTYITGIVREAVGGYIHPFFSLATGYDESGGGTQTYRGSCSNPNFQNMPIRDKEAGMFIRNGIFSRPGHLLLEHDYKGIEVKVGYCYHGDPTMFRYLTDPTTDMHRDAAADCYRLRPEQVGKHIRYQGKNGFVFPEFYGSYWAQVAPALWAAARGLATEDGVLLEEHLQEEFGGYPAFEEHVRDVEHRLWYERFPVYRRWRERWWAEYQRRGYFDTLTGFRVRGTVLGKNQSLNYPIQGPAFHCLLWSLVQLDRWLRAGRMDSRPVAQIHDAVLFDVHPEETQALVARSRIIMRDRIREEWDWVALPLDIETEITPVNGSWWKKEPYEEAN